MAKVSVDRRLVKSPPELWAEVSDPDTLARHLGEFGEIRITRTQSEKIVAWEGERASGTVEIEASGWGTRVILTAEARPAATEPRPAARTAPEPEQRRATREPLLPRFAAAPPAAERLPAPAQHPPAPARTAPLPVPEATPEPPAAASVPDAAPDIPAAPTSPSGPSAWQRRRTFLSRVFPRRPAPVAETPPGPPLAPVPEPEPARHPEPQSPEHSPPDAPAPEPEPLRPPPEVPPEPAAIVRAPATHEREAEPTPEPARDETLNVLESVLDDLGAAHHRPFSRG